MARAPTNVVLLSVDALRADHCSWLGHDRETTPALDRLAAENAAFRTAISPSSHTREAVPALLSGRYPADAVDAGYGLATETLASLLADADLRTGGFHSNPYVSRAYGFGSGFDAFDDDLHLGSHRLLALFQRALDKLRNRHYALGDTINERAFDWIDRTEEPFFCWAHYMDPHGPYAPPEDYQREFHDSTVDRRTAQRRYRMAVKRPDEITDEQRREMLDAYDGEIRYTDDCIDAFLNGLRDHGLLEETLVVVTADHGDGFGDHGYYGHPRQLYDDLLHVPLVVAGPGVPETTVGQPVSTLDVVPTILAALDLDASDLPGTPLQAIWNGDGSHPETAFASVRGQDEEADRRRFALRGQRWKATLERDVESGTTLTTALFDFESDPGEQARLDPETTDDPSATALLETLEATSAAQVESASADRNEGEEVDPAVADRLEILGYK